MGLRLADFLIVGSQRCGTTSMRRYLLAHPQVTIPKGETHFFTDHYDRGLQWYDLRLGRGKVRGDKSPNYIADPIAPERIAKDIPGIKIIMLFRNPVKRIFSHYRHMIRSRLEIRPFNVALHSYPGRPDGWYSYLNRGYYAEQLSHWLKFFPREQIHIIHSERFFTKSHAVYNETLSFLNLSPHKLKKYRRHGFRPSEAVMSSETEERLTNHYQPYNKALYDLLGQDLKWEQ